MPWTAENWPPEKCDPVTAAVIFNELRAALAERNALVPANFVPPPFARWQAMRGTPAGRDPGVRPTVANFQHPVQEMLSLVWPVRWWDLERDGLYALADLCRDAFGADAWSWDLTGANRVWAPAATTIFSELHAAINRLECVRLLPTVSEAERRDSVSRLTFNGGAWADERAATFALFDGSDDGQTAELEFDVGLGGEAFDAGTVRAWVAESRQFRMRFATAALGGRPVRRAWLDFTTAAPVGAADFGDTFTAEVADAAGTTLDSFASDEAGPRRVEVPPESIDTSGDTSLFIRSARPDSDDRPAWSPPGPDYTSTYREGLAIAGPVRLILEVDFEYHGERT